MSLTEKGRKFPPDIAPAAAGSGDLAQEVAAALRREFGERPAMTKTVARITGARERTVKNWLAGSHGPSGDHLIALMRQSEEVLAVVLRLSGREALLRGDRIAEAQFRLQDSLRVMGELLEEFRGGGR